MSGPRSCLVPFYVAVSARYQPDIRHHAGDRAVRYCTGWRIHRLAVFPEGSYSPAPAFGRMPECSTDCVQLLHFSLGAVKVFAGFRHHRVTGWFRGCGHHPHVAGIDGIGCDIHHARPGTERRTGQPDTDNGLANPCQHHGAMLGSLVAGFVLLPVLGIENPSLS